MNPGSSNGDRNIEKHFNLGKALNSLVKPKKSRYQEKG